MKKLLALLLSVALLLTFAACNKSDDKATEPADDATEPTEEAVKTRMDKIKEAGVLVVGTSADYPPFEFHAEIDGKDTITGYDMMIGKYIADSLGVELQIEDMSFDGLLISLQEDKFDIVLAGMSENPERSLAADFSIETITMDWAVVIRKADEAKYNDWLADFGDTIIGVQNGTVYKIAASKMTGESDVVELATFPDLVIDLQNGTIDAIVANEMTTKAYASGNEDLISKNVGIVSDEPGQAAAIMKGQPEWMAYINAQITEMEANGSLATFIAEAEALAIHAEE